MYQAQDPNQTGMGAARRFADYVAGQYSPTWGQQGQPMASASAAPSQAAAYEAPFTEGYMDAGFRGGPTNGNGNPFDQFKNAFNDPNTLISM